jgi:hypothetical protein
MYENIVAGLAAAKAKPLAAVTATPNQKNKSRKSDRTEEQCTNRDTLALVLTRPMIPKTTQ